MFSGGGGRVIFIFHVFGILAIKLIYLRKSSSGKLYINFRSVNE